MCYKNLVYFCFITLSDRPKVDLFLRFFHACLEISLQFKALRTSSMINMISIFVNSVAAESQCILGSVCEDVIDCAMENKKLWYRLMGKGEVKEWTLGRMK